jgi:hypothetical protein
VFQSVKKCNKGVPNLQKVGVRRWNKLEKVLEKCERLEAKIGILGGMRRRELGGGEYVLCIAVQRYF